jgi:N utilization substance protein B
MLSRKKTRELLMKLIYQMTLFGHCEEDAKTQFLSDYAKDHPDEEEPDRGYFDRIFQAVAEHRSHIDEVIAKASDHWKINRISKVDLSILRIAAAEILFFSDIPPGVSANEAVELAKKYGGENSPKFINGLLGNIVREFSRTSDTEIGGNEL